MEAKFTLDVHADADTLEEYAFGRLPEAVSDALEEHLLICPRCQRAMADVDEYVLLMKYATARLAPDRRGSRLDSGLASLALATAGDGRDGSGRGFWLAGVLAVEAPPRTELRATDRASGRRRRFNHPGSRRTTRSGDRCIGFAGRRQVPAGGGQRGGLAAMAWHCGFFGREADCACSKRSRARHLLGAPVRFRRRATA